MSVSMRKRIAKQVPLSTTGNLLTGVASADWIRITSADSNPAKIVYLETGAVNDGGAVPTRAEPILVGALPVEICITGMGSVKLYASAAMNATVVLR